MAHVRRIPQVQFWLDSNDVHSISTLSTALVNRGHTNISTTLMENGDHLRNFVRATSCKSVEESQRNYAKWAETYEKDLLDCGYSAHLMVCKRMCEKFPPETRPHVRILDVGAGTGLVAKELRKQGFKHIDALEPQETMLNKARRLDLYENYFQAFITEKPLDIPANTYDALTGSGIYAAGGHVPCEAVIEMIRLVKPGGFIALSTRHTLLQESEICKPLEPLMDQLEAEGKWMKDSREIRPRFYLDKDGIVWCYKVL